MTFSLEIFETPQTKLSQFIQIQQEEFEIHEVQHHSFFPSKKEWEEGAEPQKIVLSLLHRKKDQQPFVLSTLWEKKEPSFLLFSPNQVDISEKTVLLKEDSYVRFSSDFDPFHYGQVKRFQLAELHEDILVSEDGIPKQTFLRLGSLYFEVQECFYQNSNTFLFSEQKTEEVLEYQINNQIVSVHTTHNIFLDDEHEVLDLFCVQNLSTKTSLLIGMENNESHISPTGFFQLHEWVEDLPQELEIIQDFGSAQVEPPLWGQKENATYPLRDFRSAGSQTTSSFDKKTFFQLGKQFFQKEPLISVEDGIFFTLHFPIQERNKSSFEMKKESSTSHSLLQIVFLFLLMSWAFVPFLAKEIPFLLRWPSFQTILEILGVVSVFWIAVQKWTRVPLLLATNVVAMTWLLSNQWAHFFSKAPELVFRQGMSLPFSTFFQLTLLFFLLVLSYTNKRLFYCLLQSCFWSFWLSAFFYVLGFLFLSLIQLRWQGNFFSSYSHSSFSYVVHAIFVLFLLRFWTFFQKAPLKKKEFIQELKEMNSLFQEWKQDIKNTNDLKKSIRHTVASFSISNNAAIHALSPLLVVLEKLQDRVEEIDLLVEDVVVYFQPAFREEMNVFLQDWNEMIDSIESKQLKVEIPRLPEFFFLPLEYQEVEEED